MKLAGFILDSFTEKRYGSGEGNAAQVFASLDIPQVSVPAAHGDGFLKTLYDASDGYEAVVLAYCDSAWYSVTENRRLKENFIQYKADYAFGDNYPAGIVMEIVLRSALPVMENMRKQKELAVTRNIFQDIIQIDVNMFDLENLYAPVALRTHRLSFFADSQQNCEVIAEVARLCKADDALKNGVYNSAYDFKELGEMILRHRDALRTTPKYFEIEVSTACSQQCSFCPRTALSLGGQAFMPVKDYQAILKKITAWSHAPVIALTGMGDAHQHPEILAILESTLKAGAKVFLESSAAGLPEGFWDNVMALPEQDKLTLVISIDAVDEELYSKLRPGDEPLQSLLEKITYVLLRRKEQTYVQVIKMNENVDHLVDYYRYFEKYTKNIIIQKYNHYRSLLPERRLNPMQPFEKIDCWHLKRDMVIDVKGQVLMCKQDLKKEHVLGNAVTEALPEIHTRGADLFKKHLDGFDYCKSCDEYYTYNF